MEPQIAIVHIQFKSENSNALKKESELETDVSQKNWLSLPETTRSYWRSHVCDLLFKGDETEEAMFRFMQESRISVRAYRSPHRGFVVACFSSRKEDTQGILMAFLGRVLTEIIETCLHNDKFRSKLPETEQLVVIKLRDKHQICGGVVWKEYDKDIVSEPTKWAEFRYPLAPENVEAFIKIVEYCIWKVQLDFYAPKLEGMLKYLKDYKGEVPRGLMLELIRTQGLMMPKCVRAKMMVAHINNCVINGTDIQSIKQKLPADLGESEHDAAAD